MELVRTAFEVQGHRGARGLRAENTLPSFEVAFDLGVSSVETDVHLTADAAAVLVHDPAVSVGGAQILIRALPLAELRALRADANSDLNSFPQPQAECTPLAKRLAADYGIDPFGIPTLTELFGFAESYAGELGREAGKTREQQEHARRVVFDLELKRVPFLPMTIGDGYDGTEAGLLERRVLEEIDKAGLLARTRVRSFDHRSLVYLKKLQPKLETAALIAYTAPVDPGQMLLDAGADVYAPEYRFVDAEIVRLVHAAGKRILPWTVNEPHEWERLLTFGVDGVTTDYPDRLLAWLKGHQGQF
jgi:glycerophosphoryl diester phosphodiesterase